MSKDKLIPELRFPEFQNEEGWDIDQVQNLVSTISPPKKFQSSEYRSEGDFPIIDQSQSFYCGYTNDSSYVVSDDLPLVIFGDHTCALKMAREPFAQGADGIKILKAKKNITPEFLYQFLIFNGVKQESYKRHFAQLKEKNIAFPSLKTGEQQKIASCLSSLDELLAAHNEKLDALKNHKKGLMQNLFPQEGETVPKVRFPEFEGEGAWNEKRLGKIGEPLMCKRIFKDQTTPNPENGIPFYKIGTFGKEPDAYIPVELYDEFKSKYNFPNKGDILISASGTIGRLVIYDDAPAYFQDSNIVWLGHDGKQVTNDFLYHCYSIVNWQTSDGGVIKRLYNSDLKAIPIKFPENEIEQQKIASCLSALDELITAQAEMIEHLQQHKKGMMQGLFPRIET